MADTATTTLAEFIAAYGIEMTCTGTDHNPSMEDSADMDHWKCALVRPVHRLIKSTGDYCYACACGDWSVSWEDSVSVDITEAYADHTTARMRAAKSKMTLTFSLGYGHHGAEPKLADVLDCLSSDAAGVANAQSFEDWCSDYGYDPVSRKAEKIYKACGHQAARLERFLGADAYQRLLWNTERM